MPRWTVGAFTLHGRVRPSNEDAVAIGNLVLTGDMAVPRVTTTPSDSCLLIIADGLGGQAISNTLRAAKDLVRPRRSRRQGF